jgi:hypothetical protein
MDSLTFEDNGSWKLYTKAETSPITATISTKHLVIKLIAIMLTIFYNYASVVSWVILANNIFYLKMVERPKHVAV